MLKVPARIQLNECFKAWEDFRYFKILCLGPCIAIARSLPIPLIRSNQHSVLGITSLLFAGLSLVVLFIAVLLLDFTDFVHSRLIGFLIFAEAIVSFMGVLIGIPAFFCQSKIRVFAFIGVGVNVASLIFALYMIL